MYFERYFLLLLVYLLSHVPARAQTWITGYYTDNALSMSDIPWSKITHAIQFKAYPADGSGSLAGIPGANADQFTAAAHAAGVKALLCVADNNGNHGAFPAASANLNTFVANIASFVNAHNYDGVDLDWEASSYGPGKPDGANYINLISTLRSALGPDKIITISVYWNNGLESVVQATQAQLNQVNIMCYDMDQWLSWTNHNDSTYTAPGDTQSASCAAEAAHFAGYIPAAKIGLGIPFYGRIWSGCADAACSDGLHAPGVSWYGTPTQKTILYRDLINSPYWSAPQIWDPVRGASYISIDQPGAANDRFITFTGVQQINEIARMARAQGYGGYMLYELEYDFVSTAAGDARHPLASAVYAAVGGVGPAIPPIPVPASPVPIFFVPPQPASPDGQPLDVFPDPLVGGAPAVPPAPAAPISAPSNPPSSGNADNQPVNVFPGPPQ